MGMGFAPTWLRQVTPTPASQNHFNHWLSSYDHENTLSMPNVCTFTSKYTMYRYQKVIKSLYYAHRP